MKHVEYLILNEEYIKNDGLKCPFCKSKDICTGEYDFGCSTVYQAVICNSCHKEWTDEYELVRFTPILHQNRPSNIEEDEKT